LILWQKKSGGGGGLFLLGFFGILVRFVVVNRGEVVVICVAKVVSRLSLCRGRKIGHSFQLYFSSVFETA
jgi:hypothetical protein